MADRKDLIQRLCVQAGIIMEDVGADAISVVSNAAGERRARLVELSSAVRDMSALIAAAEVLDRRGED